MLATLITVSAITTRARTAVISLTRNGTRPDNCRRACRWLAEPGCDVVDIRLGRGKPQHVPDAAQRVDQPRLGAVDLAAEHGYVRLDDPGVPPEVVVPDVVEDLHLGQHPVGVAHEVPQQLELGRG